MTLPAIAGYTLVAQISRSDRAVVYQAVQDIDQRPVIIKLLRSEYPSESELVQFYNQYTIAHNLSIPGIVKPLSLEPWANGYALVMEDCGSISLRNYMQVNTLSLEELLNISIQLAEILQDLYQHRVIHKDIKIGRAHV